MGDIFTIMKDLISPFRNPPPSCGEIAGSIRSMLGHVNMRGDPELDCDEIAQMTGPERRWHSFPGGRLCINPASHRTFVIDPTPPDLSLDLGGYVGVGVLRLPKVIRIDLLRPDGAVNAPLSQRTNWFPYKLAMQARHDGGAIVDVEDCFVDADSSLIRLINIRHAGSLRLRLSAEMPDGARLEWQAARNALLVTGKDYHYALCLVQLETEGGEQKRTKLRPNSTATEWNVEWPLEGGAGCFAVSFGFALRSEGGDVAVERAQGAQASPLEESMACARSVMQNFLRRVPAPTHWGLDPSLAVGVTPEQQRQAYYAAWSFLYQNLIEEMPENVSYPYPQMSVGKGSLWADGEEHCPATCAWESLMAIQWLALVDPDTAWRIYAGIMTLVDNEGLLGGESLPSRKAETAWKLVQLAPDRKRLAAVYPSIKRYLLWREANPRWIWFDMKAEDERDLEFLASWLYDLEFAEQIAQELGLADEAALWRSKAAPGIRNMRDWFFRDPQRLHQLYFIKSGTHSIPNRASERPVMILSALRIRCLPDDMTTRLLALFREHMDPEAVNAGFNYSKYPDNQLVALGLLDRGLPEARPFIEAILRDAIRAGEFTECLVTGPDNRPALDGVKPSIFTALNVIDFTMLLNHVRYDAGRPYDF